MDALPRQVGRYQVQEVIGRGAMGVILRAHDPLLDRSVAVKLMARELLEGTEGADFLARFEREARAAGRCSHRNIVGIYDFGTMDGRAFLVMELVPGQGLDAVLRTGRRFTPAETAGIILQVLDALALAHGAGVVHRDIKPANILLLPDLTVKLTDFGIARLAGSELTQLGDMVGTPAYMSPEQCRGEPVDGRSDLFSTGAVLHELLTGTRAFAGATLAEVVRRVMDMPPAPLPPELIATFPALPGLLARALEKRPGSRFPNAEAMATALRAAMGAEDATLVASRQGAAPAAAMPPDPAALEAARKALLPHIGPLAGVLVKRAAADGAPIGTVWQRLASHIEKPAERAVFLAKRPV